MIKKHLKKGIHAGKGHLHKLEKTVLRKIDALPPFSGMVNFLYVFLIMISIVYASLIWGFRAAIERETNFTEIPNHINYQEKALHDYLDEYPIDAMVPYIAKRDKQTAAFLIGIAKKESNWGKRSPKRNSQECFNYWGYRGTYNQTRSGYSCFDSPEQAVAVVGGRIDQLIKKDVSSPKKMVIWKCGWDSICHETTSAKKWIDDVDLYYKKYYKLTAVK